MEVWPQTYLIILITFSLQLILIDKIQDNLRKVEIRVLNGAYRIEFKMSIYKIENHFDWFIFMIKWFSR